MAETALIAIIGVMLIWLIFFVMPRINKERCKKLVHIEIIALADLSVNWTKLNGKYKRIEKAVIKEEEELLDNESEISIEGVFRVLDSIINVPDEKGHYSAFTQDRDIYIHSRGLRRVLNHWRFEASVEDVNALRDSLGGVRKYIRYIDGKRDKADMYVKLPTRNIEELMEFEARKPETFSIILKEK